MCLGLVSRAELDAVVRRLRRSARTFGTGATSTNSLERALLPLIGEGAGTDDEGGDEEAWWGAR